MDTNILKLESQLCFPLYVCSKEVIKRYKPFLDELDLTYTQYITLLALWEKDNISVSELGSLLYLDSGTLTPLLKKLEKQERIVRIRKKEDERTVMIKLTEKGKKLRDQAIEIPAKIGSCLNIEMEDAILLHKLLNKVTKSLKD